MCTLPERHSAAMIGFIAAKVKAAVLNVTDIELKVLEVRGGGKLEAKDKLWIE